MREAEAGLLEAEEATANEHHSQLIGAEAEAQTRGLCRAIYGSTGLRGPRCGGDDDGDGLRGLLGLCIGDFFFFLINSSSPLCSVSSVLVCLVC